MSGPPPRVLLVEDDAAHAELAARSLGGSPEAPQLVVVASLDAALAWLRTHQADLVLADLKLPDGSGLELLTHRVPLVVLTSQGDESQAVAAMKGGAIDYLVKSPEMYRELPIALQRALRAAGTIAERNRAEASLRASEARFQQLAETIQEAFWLYDVGTRRIVYSSPAFHSVYGIPEDGGDLAALREGAIHPEDAKRVAAAFAEQALVRPATLEFRVADAGGAARWVNERTFPIFDSDGQPVRIAVLGADVTRPRELESALRQAQKMDAIGQLAGGVAHDFNNMLTAIMSAAEEIDRLTDDAQAKSLCAMIISASERAADLTRNLLAFSRKGRIRSGTIDLHHVVRQTVALLARSVDRNVAITTALASGVAPVRGDAAQLQNALLNIAINARDAMPNGGTVTFSSAFAVLDAAACAAMPFDIQPGRFVRVSIEDTGEGIAPEHLTRIFEPFFTLKQVGKGTGLGLAAVYGTAVEHGGAVLPFSKVGHGTVFHLYLPLAEGPLPAPPAERHTPEGRGVVLLIDDEPLVSAVSEQALRSLGYDVITARDGVDGVARFAEHPELVAVVCDLVMPRLGGAEAIRRMRAIRPNVPMILCSGFPRDAQIDNGGTPDAHLTKPFRRADLADTLAHLLAARPP